MENRNTTPNRLVKQNMAVEKPVMRFDGIFQVKYPWVQSTSSRSLESANITDCLVACESLPRGYSTRAATGTEATAGSTAEHDEDSEASAG